MPVLDAVLLEAFASFFPHQVNREKDTFSFQSETISLWKHESFYININHHICPGVKWMETGLCKVAVLTWK